MPRENKFGIVHSRLPLRFREYREAKGLTLEEVANQLKTSKGRISRKETRQETFSNYFLEAFARAVGVEPMLMFAPDDEIREMIELWSKCDQPTRKAALRSLRGMAEAGDDPPRSPSPASPSARLPGPRAPR